MKRSKHVKPIHNFWSYDGDGRFPTNKIKGKDKQYIKRWRRRLDKKAL